jgi:SOS response regulatory protein OraA/RecX
MRTRKELVLMLSRKRVPAEVSGPVLDRLEEVGLVNDGSLCPRIRGLAPASRPR